MHSLLVWSVVLVSIPLLWKAYQSVVVYPPLCPSHGGFTHPDFEDVKQVFIENIVSGYDKGAAFSVMQQGELLVELWGGCADQITHTPWKRDTISQAWSTTKGVTAIVLGHLVDKGLLDYKKCVSHYWPEFAENGKENITVGMLFSHQAGVSNLQRPISLVEYRDNWTSVEALLAKQKPLWEPGSIYNYHAFTYGMYADAFVRKLDRTHRNISEYFKEEIAIPLGIDFYIGLPREKFPRSTQATYTSFWGLYVDFLIRPDNWATLPMALWNSRILYDSMQVVGDVANNFELMNKAEMREIGLSSSNGFGTAQSLAKLFDYVANNGTVQGKRLVSQNVASVLSTPITKDIPVIIAPKCPFSPLGSMVEPNRHGMPTSGHRGYGGQHAYGDMQYQVGVAYLTSSNHGSGDVEDQRLTKLLDVLYRCLAKFHKKRK